MSDLIKTLQSKANPTDNVYPNIKGENIPDNAVTTPKLNNNAVTTQKINDGAITTAKITDGAVTTSKINSNAVTSGKIATGAVTNTKIDDGAVTSGKIAVGAVSTAKIADGAVTTSKMDFHLYEHVYLCSDSVYHIRYIIRFVSSAEPFPNADELFEFLYNTYGVNAPVAIQTNPTNLSDIFGYVNDSMNLEFTDTNDETYNSYFSNVTFTSYSQTLF